MHAGSRYRVHKSCDPEPVTVVFADTDRWQYHWPGSIYTGSVTYAFTFTKPYSVS